MFDFVLSVGIGFVDLIREKVHIIYEKSFEILKFVYDGVFA